MVTAVFRKMPLLLKYALKHPNSKDAQEKAVLEKTLEIADRHRTELDFQYDETQFYAEENETMRLMRTGPREEDPIHVNTVYLNRSGVITIPLLAQFFFHEYCRKIPGVTIADCDKAARFFSMIIEPSSEMTPIGARKLHVFSLPMDGVQSEYTQVSVNLPQPTYLVLLDQEPKTLDLTPWIDEQLHFTTSSVRSMWAEANKAFYAYATQMADQMKRELAQVRPQAEAPLDRLLLDGLTAFLNDLNYSPNELRLLGIHGAEALERADGSAFIALKGTFSVSHKNKAPILMDDVPLKENFPVPVVIDIYLSGNAGEVTVQVQPRPQMDYQKTAKIRSIVRNGELPVMIKLRIAREKPPKSVHLIIKYPSGYILLGASRIEPSGPMNWDASFNLPADLAASPLPFVTDSVLIDSEESFFMDRAVDIKEGAENSKLVSERDFNAEHTGFWGDRNGRMEFRASFPFDDPSLFTENGTSTRFNLNPARMVLDFELPRRESVREVRIHFKRHLMMSGKIDETQSHGHYTIDGNREHFAISGGKVETRDIYEEVSIPGDRVQWQSVGSGRERGIVKFKMAFKKVRELKGPQEAHFPALAYPISLELITVDFRSLKHYFGEALAEDYCEYTLKGGLKMKRDL